MFKGNGRGDDDLQEVVHSEALRAKLAGFRAWKQAVRESLAADAPRFVSQRGLRLSTRQLRHAFGIWQVRAGFERHVSAHSLRYSACTNIYASSKDLRLTQRFARHRSIVTTMLYTHPNDEDLVRAVELRDSAATYLLSRSIHPLSAHPWKYPVRGGRKRGEFRKPAPVGRGPMHASRRRRRRENLTCSLAERRRPHADAPEREVESPRGRAGRRRG